MLLYIHIPFCDSKCHYCAFNSYVDKFDRKQAYMNALVAQWHGEKKRFTLTNGCIQTVFVGGGTPSTVAPELYEPLFNQIAPYLKENAEITFEANPNSATRRWLAGIKALGATRISFGVQSFNIDKLRLLNRSHSPAQAIRAVNDAAEVGFEHLSLDLIYNVAGDTHALLEHDISAALNLPVDHLSAYELTIERGTAFAAKPRMRQNNDDMAFFVAKRITKHGFEHYEISNFGAYRCAHNLGYWHLKPYIGLGAGAVGYVSRSKEHYRYYPHRDIDTYIADPNYAAVEYLDTQAQLTERIFLGLRSIVGIDQATLPMPMRRRADSLVEEGKLRMRNGRYCNDNFFIADEIALFILD